MSSAARTFNSTLYKDFYVLKRKFYPTTTLCPSICMNWCILSLYQVNKPKLLQSENSHWLLYVRKNWLTLRFLLSEMIFIVGTSPCIVTRIISSCTSAAVLDQQAHETHNLNEMPCCLGEEDIIQLSNSTVAWLSS